MKRISVCGKKWKDSRLRRGGLKMRAFIAMDFASAAALTGAMPAVVIDRRQRPPAQKKRRLTADALYSR
jgi:hypothetical protein